MKKRYNIISLFWQAPFSLFSYTIVYLLKKVLIQYKLNNEKKSIAKNTGLKWRGWSELSETPARLLTTMILSPRWNPHSVQHFIGPINVKSKLGIQIGTAKKSAKQWIISIYKERREIKTISSYHLNNDLEMYEIDLDPGNYVAFLRYYNWTDNGKCPEISIDHTCKTPQNSIERETKAYQSFLNSIQNKKGLIYFLLHYYVYIILKWRILFKESFLKKQYLPYGNPGTDFTYGVVKKGKKLHIDFDVPFFEYASVYVMILNRYGFPIFWESVTDTRYNSHILTVDGTYLIRIIYYQKGNEMNSLLSKTHVSIN